MKVFLGWSGETSKKVAQTLHGWLPRVIQSIRPYLSSEDIAKGARWAAEIAKELQASHFGVICVTRANVTSPWINFEAGALSREIEKSYVTPLLFDLKPSDIQGPLAQFQWVINDREEILKLLESMNSRQDVEHQLERNRLSETFEMWWPTLQDSMDRISKEDALSIHPPKRDSQDILEEVLNRVRLQQNEMQANVQQITAMHRDIAVNLEQGIHRLGNVIATLTGNLEALTTRIYTRDFFGEGVLAKTGILRPSPPPGFIGRGENFFGEESVPRPPDMSSADAQKLDAEYDLSSQKDRKAKD